MNIFDFESYKEFLKAYLKQYGRPGIMSDLARMAGCNRSYLSQALNGKAQLTPDQAVNLGEAMKLDGPDKNYFLLLVLFERAADANARQIFSEKIAQAKRENLILAKQIRGRETPEDLAEAQKSRYYSTWLYGAIHILVSMKEFQTVAAVAEKLRIDLQTADEILSDLAKMKLVEKKAGRYIHSGKNLHVDPGSPYYAINNVLWRNRANERASFARDGIHYTTAFSISKSDWPKLKRQLIDFIETQRATVHASGTDEMFCFCCDLFAPV